MPLGLITNSKVGGPSRIIDADAEVVDLHALFGSPSGAVSYTLIIPAGVTVGNDFVSGKLYSIDATGFDASSVGIWIVAGDIIGKGGYGGDGGSGLTPGFEFKGGGGGGGAGVPPGPGGTGFDTATDGEDGIRLTGGAAGASNTETPDETTAFVAQGLGFDAVRINHPITVQLSGLIACGGAGGASGNRTVAPTAGSDIGVSGTSVNQGFAIRYSESGDATVNLIDSGEVKGTVG